MCFLAVWRQNLTNPPVALYNERYKSHARRMRMTKGDVPVKKTLTHILLLALALALSLGTCAFAEEAEETAPAPLRMRITDDAPAKAPEIPSEEKAEKRSRST